MSIKTMVHDFEDAIINAVKVSFVVTYHYCCWFHFKQALQRKMEELKMEEKFIKGFLRLFDFLTIVDRSLILFGVEYIRMKSAYLEGFEEHTVLIDKFIDEYFIKQWCTKRLIPMWNYNGREGWEKKM